jgi:hypothetical protein
MDAARKGSTMSVAEEQRSLPALLRGPEEPACRFPLPPETAPEIRRLDPAKLGAVLLVVPVVYFGARLAHVDAGPALPPGPAAEETSVVIARSSASAGDAGELRTLRRLTAEATAQEQIAPLRTGRNKERDDDRAPGNQEPTGSSGGGTGDDGSSSSVTLPIAGETPVPDPGVDTPELPVDPSGTLPDTDVSVPDLEIPLP